MLPYFKGFTITFIIIWFLNQNLPPQTCFSYIYIVYFNLILIQFTLVHFDYIQSIRSYAVHSVNMGPLQSILVLFRPLQFIQSYSVYIGLIRSILSITVLFSPIWSYLVHFGSILSIRSTLVLFGLILSTLVLPSPFSLIWSY